MDTKMTFILKKEYHFSYPAQIRDWNFRFVSAAIHPQLFNWTVLLLGQDGELYAMKKEHVKMITPLELVL